MGRIRLTGATSGYTELRAANAAGNNTITLPTTSGGEVIVSDSSGNVNIDGGTLYVDATNNRVGIGTSSVSDPLHVVGTIRTSSGSNNAQFANNFLRANGAGTFYFDQNTGGQDFQFRVSNVTNLDTTALTITSAGRLGIGTSTPSFGVGDGLEVARSGVATVRVSSNTQGVELRSDGGTGTLETRGAFPLLFGTQGSERCRLDSSGRLLVGTSSAASNYQIKGGAGWSNTTGVTPNFQIAGTGGNFNTGVAVNKYSADGYGAVLSLGLSLSNSLGTNTLVTNNNPVGVISFNGNDGTNFIPAAQISCETDGTTGTNDMPGRLLFFTTADGASSPTERLRITSTGEALFGKTSDDNTANGARIKTAADSNFLASFTTTRADGGGSPFFINRQSSDGTLIEFRQADTAEGSISVSGTTVSYNGAHLSRWSQIPGIDSHDKDQRPEILRGTVMSNLDEMCDWIDPESGEAQDNEQLNKTKVSDVEGDKNVAGVFQSWDDGDDTWMNDYYLAMTGDFIIRIGAGVTVERGDLLMSAGDGTAKPQGDGYVQDKTIAKVTSTNVSCTYPDGSYCVPCVLMAC